MANPENKPEKGLKFVDVKFGEGKTEIETDLRKVEEGLLNMQNTLKFVGAQPESEPNKEKSAKSKAAHELLLSMTNRFLLEIGFIKGQINQS